MHGGEAVRRDVVTVVENMLREYPNMKGQAGKLARLWCACIEEALEERPERQRMVEMRYFEGQSDEAVQEALPLSRNVYLQWRSELVATVAAKAAFEKLVRP